MILLTNEHTPSNMQYRNMRIAYLIAIVITILLGLFSRKWGILLPSFVAQNAGDMLWAMMVYFGFRLLLVSKSTLTAIWLSFFFSFGIEFSQLYQEDWINQIRGTTLGALILGKGFLAEDLVRYTVGIIVASVLDKVTLKFTLRN
ncbi:ribosomal maturation YjgA family protein [Lysinibacillus xylanilyticus]|uniref:ribosomal maturation YjgA family protein n=1 Tax=Lysinibacillus xylanilyticus TaxID=582475 RepID=UPI0036D92600